MLVPAFIVITELTRRGSSLFGFAFRCFEFAIFGSGIGKGLVQGSCGSIRGIANFAPAVRPTGCLSLASFLVRPTFDSFGSTVAGMGDGDLLRDITAGILFFLSL